MRVLAIETSCDDTSLAVVSDNDGVIGVEQLVSYTQVTHLKYGGVVPEIASREHADQVTEVFKQLVQGEYVTFFEGIDAIVYTATPGLPGSLVVGEAFAKVLARQYDKQLLPVNHIYGHIFSIFLERKVSDIALPLVVLTASGGHNDLYKVEEVQEDQKVENADIVGKFRIEKLGGTLDDASGECFDKVARMLGGPYPGGPWISKQAAQAVPDPSFSFTRIFLKADEHKFSFSGMKSQVYNLLHDLEKRGEKLTEERVCAIAWEFQEAVVEVLAKKLVRAGLKYGAKTIALAGGVSANVRLWEYVNSLINKKKWLYNQVVAHSEAGETTMENIIVPELIKPVKFVYSTDNGAMIGAAALMGM